MSEQGQELAQQPTKLLTIMAAEYGMDAGAFKNVLLKTVFPREEKDRPAPTVEQLGMFCIVAHKYKLNPLIREIFAFPSKGGGIVPVVSVDGWISLVQRQANYNGHKFVYEWKDGKVGGVLLAATCFIYRKDLQNPIEHTEFMEECLRGTDVWQKWPRRMLTHKTFIQCARYAFGFSGIYDEDEGERILEGTLKASTDGNFIAEISMPKRVEQLPESIPTVTVPANATIQAEPVKQVAKVIDAEPRKETPVQNLDSAKNAPVQNLDSLKDLFASGQVQKGSAAFNPANAIGRGRAQRLYAILNKHKIHTEDEAKQEFLRPLGLEHLQDMPVDIYEQVCDWAEGKLEAN